MAATRRDGPNRHVVPRLLTLFGEERITSRDECLGPEHAEAQFKAILERILRAYHRDERHGGANWIGERSSKGSCTGRARRLPERRRHAS